MVTLQEIQEKLKSAIRQSGLTQKAIGEKIGVKQSCIAHYIKGDRTPTLDTFANLCVILELDANDILGINKANFDK